MGKKVIQSLDNDLKGYGAIKGEYDDLSSQLAEKAQQADLNTTNANVTANAAKIGDLTQLNTTDKSTVVNALKEIKIQANTNQTSVANIGNASPKGTYATLSALQTAFPTGTTGIYVVTADGNWYYWNGASWTAGGVYQATSIADNSITEGKTTFIDKSTQIYDWQNDTGLVSGYRVSNVDGTLFAATGYSATGFVSVSPSRNLLYGDQKGSGGVTLISLNNSAVYDANKNFIVGYGGGDSGVIHALPSNAAYIRKSFNGGTTNAQNLGVFYDSVSTDFTYWRKLNSKIPVYNADHATSADSATNATNATNATSATNWTNLSSIYNYSLNRYDFKSANLEQQLSTTTGQLSPHSGIAVSDYCELVGAGKVYLGYTGNYAYQSSFSNIVLYDQNNNMIQNANTLADYAVDTSVTPNMISFTPPSNAKYIRFQMQLGYTVYDFYKYVYLTQGSKPTLYNTNLFYYKVLKDSSSKWANKKIVAFGDSTSAGTSYSPLTWLGKVCQKLQAIPVNRAIGGSQVSNDNAHIAWVADGTTDPTIPYGEYISRPASLDDGSGTGNLSSTQPAGTVQINSSMSTDDRVNTIPSDAAVIVILAGTNGMDSTSYETMIQKIFARCPNAIVMCCSITFRYDDTTYSTITDVSGNNTIIQNLCPKYGSHYINLKEIECINQYNHSTYMIDNVHASDAGNDRRGRTIAKAIQLIEPLS